MNIQFNIIKISLLTFSILSFTSCGDIIDEVPKDRLSPSQFYNSDDEAKLGINGVYSNLQSWYANYHNEYDYAVWGTDICVRTAGRNVGPTIHYTLSLADPFSVRSQWQNLYRWVGDANQFISRVSANNGSISEGVKTRTLGEAYFLRAMAYYYLTVRWGDVPMWLDELEVDKISGNLERTSVLEVRQQIIEDLKIAEDYLPSIYDDENGRATKWAAKVLMVYTYLWLEDWQNAKSKAGEIISESPHILMTNYEDIFGIINEFNQESIFEIDYNESLNRSTIPDAFVPRFQDDPELPGYGADKRNGFGNVAAAPEFIASFAPDDKRKKMYNWPNDWPELGVVEPFNYSYVYKGIDWGSRNNHGLNKIIYRLADVYLLYAEAENQLNGPSQDGLNKINEVRKRAFDETDNLYSMVDFQTKEQFHKAIVDERKWELGFECFRKWDLNRWGILTESIQTMNTSNPVGASNVRSYHMLLPIPPEEIQLNPSLEQNPGYNNE